MLKPAILYKDELERKFCEYIYSDEFFLYSGYLGSNTPPNIEIEDGLFQYAIIDGKKGVIGYFSYRIDYVNDTVDSFGLYSFDKGNIEIGRSVFEKMEELVDKHRRIEWRMIGGNPVVGAYNNFCKKHNGNIVLLRDVTKDDYGKYRNEYIFEIVKRE